MTLTLTIVIPVRNPPDIDSFIRKNRWAFKRFPVIVINRSGGEKLEKYATEYIDKPSSLWEARKMGYEKVTTPYVLNLDADVIIPKRYIERALALEADVVSIFYEDVNHCQGALEFGISLWKTDVLRRLYNYSAKKSITGVVQIAENTYASLHNGWCECTYMWRRVKAFGLKMETLPIRAKHLGDD